MIGAGLKSSMAFSQETLDELAERLADVEPQYHRLLSMAVYKNYSSSAAREFSTHGFARRLKTLKTCIQNVFNLCPPESSNPPNEIENVTINIQAFTFNLYGAIDNLAWIWVSERNIRHPDGSRLFAREVGLGPKCTLVRASLSTELREALEGMMTWFKYIEDYRHALAHRIPLYIPPYMVALKDLDRHNELTRLSAEAFRRGQYAEMDKLDAEQLALGWFNPIITHSLTSGRPVYLHGHLISNWLTLDLIANKLFRDLDELVRE